MEVIGWIVFLIYFIIFNLGWIKGARVTIQNGGVTHATLATTMLMTLISIIFLVSDINKLHLIWITPVLIFTSSLNFILFAIPVFGPLYLLLVKTFGHIVSIGIVRKKMKVKVETTGAPRATGPFSQHGY